MIVIVPLVPPLIRCKKDYNKLKFIYLLCAIGMKITENNIFLTNLFYLTVTVYLPVLYVKMSDVALYF